MALDFLLQAAVTTEEATRYSGAWGRIYDFQELLGAIAAFFVSLVALFGEKIRSHFRNKKERNATIELVKHGLSSYKGGLLKILDSLEGYRGGGQEGRTQVAYLGGEGFLEVLPFGPPCEERLRRYFDQISDRLLRAILQYETCVQELNMLGTRNGGGYVVRIERGAHSTKCDVLMARLQDVMSSVDDLEKELH
ncbi:MAG: hypothetical protein ACKVS5_11510 [Parvularculaceae bacterium]